MAELGAAWACGSSWNRVSLEATYAFEIAVVDVVIGVEVEMSKEWEEAKVTARRTDASAAPGQILAVGL